MNLLEEMTRHDGLLVTGGLTIGTAGVVTPFEDFIINNFETLVGNPMLGTNIGGGSPRPNVPWRAFTDPGMALLLYATG